MKQIPIKLGPLALLLTVISICLTTLVVLTFSTAQADMRLAERFAETVRVRYELEKQGQEFWQEVQDSVEWGDTVWLQEYRTKERGVYERVFEEGNTSLTIRMKVTGISAEVLEWRTVRSWEQDTGLNLWDGSSGWQR